MKTNRTPESTSYHETGHAIMSWLLDIPIIKVTNMPEGTTLGKLFTDKSRFDTFDWDGFSELDWEVRKLLEEHVVLSLAGRIAEEKYLGHTDLPVYSDEGLSFQILTSLSSGSEEAQAYYNWLHIRTERKIFSETNWYIIEAVAKELIIHKELSGDQVYEIIKNAVKELIKRKENERREELDLS